jgi:epoxyqueuosine reductase QueG
MTAAEIIQSELPNDGNWVHGFADLTGKLPEKYAACPHAVSIGRRLDDRIVDGIASHGPTEAYYQLYNETNQALNEVTARLSRALAAAGIGHIPIRATLTDEELTAQHRSTLAFDISHKMAATCAGLGWIGKTSLLISHAYGPRLRLATILLAEPLPQLYAPVTESQCGHCSLCVERCPTHAATGKPWKAGVPREELLDAFNCRTTCRKLTSANLGRDESLCGICLAACPIGRRSVD